MAQNFNLGTLGQVITVNTTANTATYTSALVVGNSSVNVVINSSSVYVSGSPVGGATNTAAQYTWSNTQTFQNTITFSSTIVGTVNNALYLNGTIASGYQTTAGLSANVATLAANAATYLNSKTEGNLNVNNALTSNNSSYLGGTAAAGYQTTAGLSANVATLTANNTSFVGSVSAANVVSNAQLSANLASYAALGGATFTGAVVVSNNLTVSGNLTISGNTLIVGANNLVVADALISLHTQANLAALTSNDGKNIGLAFHYYDTADKHALIYRDNSTGRLQYHTDGDDPQTNSNPQGSNLGIIQAASFWAGNSSVYTTTNGTIYSGTSNNALYLGGTIASSFVANTGLVQNTSGHFVNSSYIATLSANNASYLGGTAAAGYQTTAGLSANVATLAANAATYLNSQPASYYTNATNITTGTLPYAQIPTNVVNTTAAFTISGVHTHSANLVMSTTAGISANGGFGTAGQVLTSNGTTVYWSTVSGGGGGSVAGSNTQVQFNNSGAFGANANFTYTSTSNTLNTGSLSMGIWAACTNYAALRSSSMTAGSAEYLVLGGIAGDYNTYISAQANGSVYIRGGNNSSAVQLNVSNTQVTVTGSLAATGDVITNYSDIRLKNVSGPILNALDKVAQIEPFYYTPNQRAVSMGADTEMKSRVGVSAQKMQEILPEVVFDSPLGEGYLTVQYERIVPLLIAAINELREEIKVLKETK